ncbi:unnamed protein product [Clonostachys solani]|uniref:Uncharacterized protein n=1 Tax=Clonostachys solani TaxID=160281 RepID=A0A9N9ZC82_9HYPO|nr:unnamed protein product [Clonostachys solani]
MTAASFCDIFGLVEVGLFVGQTLPDALDGHAEDHEDLEAEDADPDGIEDLVLVAKVEVELGVLQLHVPDHGGRSGRGVGWCKWSEFCGCELRDYRLADVISD